MKTLTRNEFGFIVGGAFNTIIGLFAGTFLIGQIIKVDPSNLVSLAIYYLMVYAILSLSYLFLSVIFKKVNKIITYRISIIIKCIYIFIIAYSGDFFINNLLLLGVLYGISEAFYWFSINYLKTDLVSVTFMKRFIGVSNIMNYIINIIFPLIFGYMIKFIDIKSASILVLCFTFLMFGCSFLIESKNYSPTPFRFKEFLKIVKKPENKPIRIMFGINFMEGLRSIHGTFNTILIVLAFNSTTGLGFVTSAYSILYILVATLFLKINTENKNKNIILLIGFLPFLASLVLAFKISAVTFIIYNTVYLSCITILTLINSIYSNTLAKREDLKDYISEYQCLNELIVGIARIIVYSILLIVGLFKSQTLLICYIVISYIMIPIYSLLIKKFRQSLKKSEEKKLKVSLENREQIDIALNNTTNNIGNIQNIVNSSTEKKDSL